MLFTHTVKTQYLFKLFMQYCCNIDGIGSVCHSILLFPFNGQGSLLGSFLFEERICFGVIVEDAIVCTYCFAFNPCFGRFWWLLVLRDASVTIAVGGEDINF